MKILRKTLYSLFAAVLVVVGTGAATPQLAVACDTCNLAFAEEVLGERANTAAGRDMLRTMRAQAALESGETVVGGSIAAMAAAPVHHLAAQTGSLRFSGAEIDRIFGDSDFIEIIQRDESLPAGPTGTVPQDLEPDVEFTVTMEEGQYYIGQGVIYDGFGISGSIPGPTIRVTEGDIVRLNFVNGGTVPHGASIHAAYTQTSKYVGSIPPGGTKSVTFRAVTPGVYMYHCAPGGHAIPMHVMFGQYGMIVVEPRETHYQLEHELGRGPDVEMYILQHEIFASGRDAVEGRPAYTAFNGKVFRYVEEPIVARPGDYIRINYLNVGPSQVSTFHIVGILWDYVYWQGHPEARMAGGQTVLSGPSDSWVIEFRAPPDEGTYLMLDHAVNNTSRGTIGLLQVTADPNSARTAQVLAEGIQYSDDELADLINGATRTISPFQPGSAGTGAAHAVDEPVVFGPEVEEVTVRIIGNSFSPKVIEIEPGTRVRWVNEEVFTYMGGEFSGIHNAVGIAGPESFSTRLLGHGESDSFVFTEPGQYEYMCAPHPYMRGRIIVREPSAPAMGASSGGGNARVPGWLPVAAVIALLLGVFSMVMTLAGRRSARG